MLYRKKIYKIYRYISIMNEEMIFDALVEWNFWGSMKEELKEREMQPKLPEAEVCLIIKGVRRAGKSRMAYLLSRRFPAERTLIVNFEDPRLEAVKAQHVFKVIEIYQKNVAPSGPELLVLDEVQNVEGWERVVRTLVDTKRCKIIVTGSSSKLMSEEYATALTGRHVDFEVFPLSFREFLKWKGLKIRGLELYREKALVLKLLEEYLEFGGFPEVVKLTDPEEKLRLLRSYFYDILTKDIVKRYKIREIQKLEEMARYCLSNISTQHSLNRIRKVVGVSLDTAERFTKYMEIARLFIFLRRFSFSLKSQITAPRKMYVIDTGFHTSAGFRFSRNIGRLMENAVAVELLRRSCTEEKTEVYYYKTKNGKEVDFLVKGKNKVWELINVCYSSGSDELNPREYISLLEAAEEFGKDRPKLTVITWNYEDEREISWFGKKGRIKFVPLWKWLLKT